MPPTTSADSVPVTAIHGSQGVPASGAGSSTRAPGLWETAAGGRRPSGKAVSRSGPSPAPPAQGLEAAPEAFLGLLKGRNFGKQLVALA